MLMLFVMVLAIGVIAALLFAAKFGNKVYDWVISVINIFTKKESENVSGRKEE